MKNISPKTFNLVLWLSSWIMTFIFPALLIALFKFFVFTFLAITLEIETIKSSVIFLTVIFFIGNVIMQLMGEHYLYAFKKEIENKKTNELKEVLQDALKA